MTVMLSSAVKNASLSNAMLISLTRSGLPKRQQIF